MTAIASVPLTPAGRFKPREPDTLAHRLLQLQLVPLDATDYSPAGLVAAITDFCHARRSAGAPSEQVLEECRAVAASRLDTAGVRLVEVLARQTLVCPVPEQLDGHRSHAVATAGGQQLAAGD
jgi:hypothetical protein